MAVKKTKLAKVPRDVWNEAVKTSVRFGHSTAVDGFKILKMLRYDECEIKKMKKKGKGKYNEYLLRFPK